MTTSTAPSTLPTVPSTVVRQPLPKDAKTVDWLGATGIGPVGLASDGTFIGQVQRQPGYRCGEILLINPQTGERTNVEGDSGGVCAFTATGNENYAVWITATDETLESLDWHLMVFDRATRTTFELAHHENGPDGRPVPAGLFTPQLHGSTVVWWSMTARAPLGNHPDVFLGDLKTRTVTTLLTDAEWPSLAYPFVYATTFTNFADLRTRTFIRHDITTNEGTTLPLPPSRNFCFTSTFGLVVTLGNRAMLVDPAGNELTASESLAASGSAPFFQPSCGDRQIVWNNPVSSWLLDGTTMKLIELARRHNANLAESAGGWIRWTEDATPSPATVDTFSAKFRFARVDDIVAQ